MPINAAEAENDKRDYIRNKRENHAAAASEQVGGGAAGNFDKIDEEFAEADQNSDLSKRKALLQEKEYDERLEIALVLQKTVKRKATYHCIHYNIP